MRNDYGIIPSYHTGKKMIGFAAANSKLSSTMYYTVIRIRMHTVYLSHDMRLCDIPGTCINTLYIHVYSLQGQGHFDLFSNLYICKEKLRLFLLLYRHIDSTTYPFHSWYAVQE